MSYGVLFFYILDFTLKIDSLFIFDVKTLKQKPYDERERTPEYTYTQQMVTVTRSIRVFFFRFANGIFLYKKFTMQLHNKRRRKRNRFLFHHQIYEPERERKETNQYVVFENDIEKCTQPPKK